MKNITYSIYTLLALLFVSCTGTDKTELTSIKVNFSDITPISQSEGKIVNLETTENSLLYDICNFNTWQDTLVVQSRSFLYAFASDGTFIGSISRKGQAGNEYLSISNVFFEDGTVGLYDFNKGTVSRFNLKGQLLSSRKCNIADQDIRPFHIFPWKDGYIALNSYGGETADRKTLCFLNKELNGGTPITGRSLQNGFSIADGIFVDDQDQVLYWEMMCDTLFTVHDNSLVPLYAIDFGEHALPGYVAKKDVYGRIDYVNKSEKDRQLFAGMARYYQRKDNMIYFSCISPENGILLCRYDENEGTARLFAVDFDNQPYTTAPFFLIKDNLVYWEIHNENDPTLNQSLFVMDLNCLK